MGGLVEAQVRAGGVVAVCGGNDPAWLDVYAGVPRVGRIAAFVNHRLPPAQIVELIASTGAGLVIAGPDVGGLDGLSVPVLRMGAEYERSLAMAEPADPGPADPHSDAWWIPTSGTSGRPKLTRLTHASIAAAIDNTALARPFEGDEVYLFPFPMCHVAGYNVLLFLAHGRPVVLVERFDAATVAAEVTRRSVTHLSLAPTMLAMLLDHLDDTGAELPSLRCITYGSAPMAPALLRRAARRLDCGFAQGYGMTELSGNAVFLSPADHRAALGDRPDLLGAAGRPGPLTEVRIAADGEIWVRGPQVMTGYVDAGDTAAAFATGADGRRWLRTGDAGRLDAEGYLFVVDRLKDVVITGGENVSSRFVEDAMAAHPAVTEVAVVGTPDPTWGEVVTAVVVRRPGASVTDEELLRWGAEHVGGFAKPRRVVVVDTLPHTTSGKVVKPVLREQLSTDALPVPAAADAVVEVDGSGVLRWWVRRHGRWSLDRQVGAAIGRSGTRPLAARTEGDGSTPAGVFPLGRAHDADGEFGAFGTGDDPGVAVGWHRITAADWWCATADHPDHDRLTEARRGPDDEHLASVGPPYEFAVLIGTHSPNASAIFLHVATEHLGRLAPTAGCVAVRRDDLVELVGRLTPNTWFVIGHGMDEAAR